MAHFGLVIPHWIGHLNPGTAQGRELKRRGHYVNVISFADAEECVRDGVQILFLKFIALSAGHPPRPAQPRRHSQTHPAPRHSDHRRTDYPRDLRNPQPSRSHQSFGASRLFQLADMDASSARS